MNAVAPLTVIALLIAVAIASDGGWKAMRRDTAAEPVSLGAAPNVSIATPDHRPASRTPISAPLLAGLRSVFPPATLVFNSP